VLSPRERSDASKRFDEIIAGNRKLHSHVQAGNAYLYQALLRFCDQGSDELADRTDLGRLLSRAFHEWSHPGALVASGLRRIAIYRRYFGFTSLWRMLIELAQIRAIITMHDRWSSMSQHESQVGVTSLHECAIAQARTTTHILRVIDGQSLRDPPS
jgi:hypothetical protein